MCLDSRLTLSDSRSPYSYPFNVDADNYPYNVDKNITVLRIEDGDGNPTGMVSWFATHGTSMNNTNTLISGDNKGFASWFIESKYNENLLPGQGSFVAAFGQWYGVQCESHSIVTIRALRVLMFLQQ